MIALQVHPTIDAQPLVDHLLPYLKRIIMDQAELKTALEGVASQLNAVGDQLGAGFAQLGKATDEIVVALSNMGGTTPEVDAAVAALQAAANALTPKADAIKAAAQALDDLNQDAA